MKRSSPALATFIVASALFAATPISSLVDQWIETFTESETSLAAGLQKTAAELRLTLPMQLDPETQLVDVIAVGEELHYIHTLPNVDAGSVKQPQVTAFAHDLRGRVCESSEVMPLLDVGTTLGYVYRDKNGIEFARFLIRKEDCGVASPGPGVMTAPSAAQHVPQEDRTVSSAVSAYIVPESNSTNVPSKDGTTPAEAQDKPMSDASWQRYRQCNAARERAYASVPADAPLGDFTAVRDRADVAFDRCLQG